MKIRIEWTQITTDELYLVDIELLQLGREQEIQEFDVEK